MFFLENVRLALASLRSNKMRALLTITASDEQGNRSIPTNLRVKFK